MLQTVIDQPTSERLNRGHQGLGVLMELRPCFDDYAGIPQETRLLFGTFVRHDAIRAGGLLNGSTYAGVKTPSGRSARAELVIGQAQHLITLDTGSEPLPPISRIAGPFGQGKLGSRLRLLSSWGQVDRLSTQLDPDLFEDWLWMRLFRRALTPDQRHLLRQARFPVARMSWGNAERLALLSRHARPVLDLSASGWDIYLGHTPSPYRIKGGRSIIRYHDAIPMLWPHTISHARSHARSHYRLLRDNVADGAWFVCTSDPVRDDLLNLFPEAERRCFVVPAMSSPSFRPDPRPKPVVNAIIQRGRRAAASRLRDLNPAGAAWENGERKDIGMQVADEPFILAVSTMEPRKNYGTLMSAAALAHRSGARFKLVMIANPGWRSEAEVRLLKQLIAEDVAYHLVDMTTNDLRVLYSAAHAVICPSRAEGFDLVTVEAMACGAPVLASDIPVHRHVCGDAALFFDPYDENALAALLSDIAALPSGSGRLAELRQLGLRRSALYSAEAVGRRWEEVFDRVSRG